MEFDSIRIDTNFYLDLLLQLHTHESSAVLIFGFVPYLSLFVVETYRYLQVVLPDYAIALSEQHEQIIRASRMRTKLFDDKAKRINGSLAILDWVTQFHRDWYIGGHKGPFAFIKKAMQNDLGIFVYDGHIIGSTHTGMMNLGFERGNLTTTGRGNLVDVGLVSQLVGEEIGRYIAQLSKWPEFASGNSDLKIFAYNIVDEKLGYKDEKSTKYFKSAFNGAETWELNLSLLMLLASINFLEHIFRQLVTGSPVSLFKLKFITLYHLCRSIEKLRDYYYPLGVLTDRSKGYFQTITGHNDFKAIKHRSALRNIFVHYRIEGVPDVELSPEASLYGLVEYFYNGQTYHEVNERLDNQIARIAQILEEWLNWNVPAGRIAKWNFS